MSTSTSTRCARCHACFYIGVLREYNGLLFCPKCWKHRKTPPKPREEKHEESN